jgi:hypothetical protein
MGIQQASAPIRPAWAYSALQRRSVAASASHSDACKECIASAGFFLMTPTYNSQHPGKKRKSLLSHIA